MAAAKQIRVERYANEKRDDDILLSLQKLAIESAAKSNCNIPKPLKGMYHNIIAYPSLAMGIWDVACMFLSLKP